MSDLPQRGGSVVGVESDVDFVGGPASAFLSGADGFADFAGGGGAAVVTSPVVLVGDVAFGVVLPRCRMCQTKAVSWIIVVLRDGVRRCVGPAGFH